MFGGKDRHVASRYVPPHAPQCLCSVMRLTRVTPGDVKPQRVPDTSNIKTGPGMRVTMVSRAGHFIHQIDKPSEGHVRRARHDCNDGYGGSGSGPFTEDGRLSAMHGASLDMNLQRFTAPPCFSKAN
jgi:hypothetical protein